MKFKIPVTIISDLLIIIGTGLIGYGVYIYKPWISITVVGGIMLCLGVVTSTRG